jgi:hypothetical protein
MFKIGEHKYFSNIQSLPTDFLNNPFTFESLVCEKYDPIYKFFISKKIICKEKIINIDDFKEQKEQNEQNEQNEYYFYERVKIKKVGFSWCWFPNFNKEYYTFSKLVKYGLYEKNLNDADVNIIIYPTYDINKSKINIQITGEHQIHNPYLFDLTLGNNFDNKTNQIIYPFFVQALDTYEHYESLFYSRNNLIIAKDFCGFIHGNPRCKTRNDFFHFLSLYKKVNSYGSLFNNVEKVYKNNWFEISQIELYSRNKFGLCFENSRDDSDYYITEKILNVKLSGAIPIYWGTSKCKEIFEKDSFLFLEDSSDDSFKKLLNQIIELDKDDNKYLEMRNKRLIDPEKIKQFRITSLTREF